LTASGGKRRLVRVHQMGALCRQSVDPIARLATGVCDCDDIDRAVFFDEENCIGEYRYKSSTSAMQVDRELFRKGHGAQYNWPDLVSKSLC